MKAKLPKISVHQINTVTGDIKGNVNKILKCIQEDHKNLVDISVFPETAISGYMCGALWDNTEFLDKQHLSITHIRQEAQQMGYQGAVIIGYVHYEMNRKNGMPKLYNAVVGFQRKSEPQMYFKRILASSNHHEDKRYFISGKETKVFNFYLKDLERIRVGVPICEDMWHTEHERNIPGEMVSKLGADIIININQSYFHYGKQQNRYDLITQFAKKYGVPVIYCNSSGLGDIVKNIVIFDGGSMVIDNKGKLIWQLPRFKEASYIVHDWAPMSFDSSIPTSKYKEITDALIFEQKEFFKLAGIKKAQVHVSGGLDSAIVAALVQKSMGKENTILITNPTKLNKRSEKYVHQLMHALDNKAWLNPLEKIYDTFMEMDKYSFGDELSDTGKASVQAVLRTVQGLAATHRFGSGIVATGNHTEIVLGWASFHDIGSIGVHALIGDLTKMELYELCEYINETLYEKEVIPKDLYDGTFKPSAELPDAPGEDPIDYKIYSGICALLIRERKSVEKVSDVWKIIQKIESGHYPKALFSEYVDIFPDFKAVLKYSFNEFSAHVQIAFDSMKKSVYKAAQAAPIVIISPRSRGFSNRETLINYYK